MQPSVGSQKTDRKHFSNLKSYLLHRQAAIGVSCKTELHNDQGAFLLKEWLHLADSLATSKVGMMDKQVVMLSDG